MLYRLAVVSHQPDDACRAAAIAAINDRLAALDGRGNGQPANFPRDDELARLTAVAEELGGEAGADAETNMRNLAAVKQAAVSELERLIGRAATA